MVDEPEPPQRTVERTASGHIKIPITPRTLPKLIRVGWALRKSMRDQDLDEDSPDSVWLDDDSSALLERAIELAADDREDEAAVSELAAMAKRHKRALRVAALGARQEGAHRESRLDNLAHRLLQAAIAGTAVEPISDEERERLGEIDAFSDLSDSRAWRVLAEREPRLADLEADARAGVFGGRKLTQLPPEEREQAAHAELEAMRLLSERLDPLVGPRANSPDVLLATHVASEVARAHLERMYEDQHPDHVD